MTAQLRDAIDRLRWDLVQGSLPQAMIADVLLVCDALEASFVQPAAKPPVDGCPECAKRKAAAVVRTLAWRKSMRDKRAGPSVKVSSQQKRNCE